MKIIPTALWKSKKRENFFLFLCPFFIVFNNKILCLKSFTQSFDCRLSAKIMFETQVILQKTPKRKMLEPEVVPKSQSSEPWIGFLCCSLFNTQCLEQCRQQEFTDTCSISKWNPLLQCLLQLLEVDSFILFLNSIFSSKKRRFVIGKISGSQESIFC